LGPGLSDSEISGFRGSESSGSFAGVKKGRKGRKKRPKQVANALRREDFEQGVESRELGKDGKGGESANPKRLGKRRKTVGFVDVEKGSPDLESEQREGEVAVAEYAPRNEEGGVKKERSVGLGEHKDRGGEGRMKEQQGIPLGHTEVIQEEKEREEEVSMEKGTGPEAGTFPPAYQRKRRGEAHQNGGEKGVGIAPLFGNVTDGSLERTDCQKNTGEENEALGMVPDVKPEGKKRPVDGGTDEVNDSGVFTTPPEEEVAPSPLSTNGTTDRSETNKSAGAGRELDRRLDGPSLKPKPNGSKRGARDGKESGDDSPPAKKRRSFGRPAVLSKVRTRPCSPGEEQGSGGVDPTGPVLNHVAVSGGAEERAKRKGVAGSEVDKANGGLVIENGSRKGPVAGAAVPEGVGERVAKRVPGSSKALLLFEEVDQQFEEDKGFMSAISTLAASTKRPMILTCNGEIQQIVAFCPSFALRGWQRLWQASCLKRNSKPLPLSKGSVPQLFGPLFGSLLQASQGCPFSCNGQRASAHFFQGLRNSRLWL
jgi:hypothetical protein